MRQRRYAVAVFVRKAAPAEKITRAAAPLLSVVAVAGCLLFNLRLLEMTFARSPRIVQPDVVGRYESRLGLVAAELPRFARVGYVSDLPPDASHPAAEGTVDFYLTQFVLAPRIVVDSRRQPLVLGNFSRPERAPHTLPGLVPFADLGGGLVLYRAGVR